MAFKIAFDDKKGTVHQEAYAVLHSIETDRQSGTAVLRYSVWKDKAFYDECRAPFLLMLATYLSNYVPDTTILPKFSAEKSISFIDLVVDQKEGLMYFSEDVMLQTGVTFTTQCQAFARTKLPFSQGIECP